MDLTYDVLGMWVAFVLTIFVFSYLLGDNILFRLAEHIFVGVAVGYTAVVAFHVLLGSKLLTPAVEALAAGDSARLLLLGLSLALGLFLFLKPLKAVSWLGSVSIAFLLGVGAALAIAGALLGTLLPQINATGDVMHYVVRYGPRLGLFSGLVTMVGTTGVLLHFYFGSDRSGRLAQVRNGIVRIWGGLGRWFLFVAFGAVLGTTFLSRFSLLVGRIEFLVDAVRGLFGG